MLENGRTYFIAGDWTPFSGQIHRGAMVISRKAPLALQLLGKKAGETLKLGRQTLSVHAVISAGEQTAMPR